MTDSSDWQQVPQKRHRHRQDTSRRDNRSSQQKPSTTTHQIPVKREVRDASRSQRYPRDIRDRRHERPPRTYPVPNLVNETIYLNEKEKDLYDKLNESGVKYIPYQSLDMINQRRKELADGVPEDKQRVTVRFAKEADINEYKKNKAAFEQIKKDTGYKFDLKNGQYDLPSPIDIFKMQANVMSTNPGEASTRPYLYQTDPQVKEHAERVNEVVARIDKDIGNPVDSKRNIIFIPYLPGTEIGTIETHSRFKNVSICNNREFVANLKERFPDKKVRGIIIRNIGRNMELYNQLTDDDLDTILERQKKDLYGLKKKDIAEYLMKRNRALHEEVVKSKESGYTSASNCGEIYDKLIDTLSSADVLDVNVDEHNRNVRNCWARSLEFQAMINKKFDETSEPKRSTMDVIYNACSEPDMVFSPPDRLTRPSFQGCDIVLDSIRDPKLKDKLKKIVKDIEERGESKKFRNDTLRIIFVDGSQKYHNSFGEHYMPEWYSAIMSEPQKLEEAFLSRPLTLGIFEITHILNGCSILSRGDPFLKYDTHIDNLSFSTTNNQALVGCLLNRSDMIFPIHIYLPDFRGVSLYTPFKAEEKYQLLGSFLIRASGKRFQNSTRYYHVFVYCDKDKDYMFFANFRSNRVIPGTVLEHVRTLYRELNTLMYSEEDLGVKLYWYNVKSTPNRYLISHYNLPEIKYKYEQFRQLFKQNDVNIDSLIEDLIPCKIYKNEEKRFILEKL